jgi:hypothetical protein
MRAGWRAGGRSERGSSQGTSPTSDDSAWLIPEHSEGEG